MICKSCQDSYGPFDSLQWQHKEHYGWLPIFGECFLCFLHGMFGPMMEPWGKPEIRAKQVYQITGPDIASPCSCPDLPSAANCEPEEWASLCDQWKPIADHLGLEEGEFPF